jgi:very-short-patch-repair endonuclease
MAINKELLSLLEKSVPNVDLDLLKREYKNNLTTFTRSVRTNFPNLYSFLMTFPGDSPQEKLYKLFLFNNEKDSLKCLTCGKDLKFRNTQRGFGKYCSRKCCINSTTMIKKSKQTFLKKYNVDHPSKCKDIILKRQYTNLLKYGHISNLHSYDAKILRRKKISENWEKIKQKTIETNLKRYGVKYNILRDEVKEVIKKVHDELYYSKYFQPRINYLKNKGFILNEDISDFSKEFLKKEKKFIHRECLNEFIADPQKLETCPCCKFVSKPEKELLDYIKENYNGKIISNDRTIIKPYEIDILLPELKLGIEMNGVYWHQAGSEPSLLFKTEQMENNGYRLIHIWDVEWYNDQDKIKQFLNSLLGNNKKIFARDCVVKNIENDDVKHFLNENHRQGYIPSKIKIGLFYNSELVSIMTFSKPRFNKKYEWELIRFSNKLGFNVIGGFSRLLKYFENEYKPKSVLTYVDRRFGNGKIYKDNGFIEIGKSKPNYFWFKNGEILKRYDTQAKNLINILCENFDTNKSEFENMTNAGYIKCEDAGNLIFAKIY